MVAPNKTTFYRCGFCRERLATVEFSVSDLLRGCFLLRSYQCPHCFHSFVRPFIWIGRLPLVGRLLQNAGTSQPAAQPGVFPTREGDVGGPFARRIAKFGRWVQRCDRKVARGFVAIIGGIWSVVWFIPGRVFGRKKRRRTKNRFLKSQR